MARYIQYHVLLNNEYNYSLLTITTSPIQTKDISTITTTVVETKSIVALVSTAMYVCMAFINVHASMPRRVHGSS